MSALSGEVRTCVREGRFEDALVQLGWSRPESDACTDLRTALLVADLLERTGRSSQSRKVLARVRRSYDLADYDLACYFLIDGLYQKRHGRLVGATSAFRLAQHHAERAESTELLCWAQLRLMGTAVDLGDKDDLEKLLARLSRDVEQAAVPAVTVAYHIFCAEREAKRGRLQASRQHSSLADSLLQSFPNAWLLGLLELQTFCLCYLEGDFYSALQHARRAFASSMVSGHQSTKVIALIDMAAAYLAAGQPARARVCIDSGFASVDTGETVYALLLETLAETQLACRQIAGCRESLERARLLVKRMEQPRSVWSRTWNLRTEARLLQREGRWQESLEAIRRARRQGLSEEDSHAAGQVLALETLAIIELGSLVEAQEAIIRLLGQPSPLSLSTRGLTQAVGASLLEKAQESQLPLSYCARALRVLGASGEASALVEIVDQFIGYLAKRSLIPREPLTTPMSATLWRPKELVCHLDAATSVAPLSNDKEEDFAAFLAIVPDCRSDPRLLGEEALRLMSGCGWIASGALHCLASGGADAAIVSYSDSRCEGASANQSAKTLPPIRLGDKGGSSFTLVLKPSGLGASVLRCAEMSRLLSVLAITDPTDQYREPATGDSTFTSGPDEELGLFRSPSMRALLASAKRVAPLNVTILLTGESGTGKEVIANAIHQSSRMTSTPYVPFNCSTIPKDMLESQLFGYRRGAFTGAAQPFRGVIRAAEGGTLFLDEIGELSLETQPKLLRFLDCGEIQPLGEAHPAKVQVRVIAATNADLEMLVSLGRFREDLFYRLNVVRFHVPPLRERREEIRPFVERFLSKHSREFEKQEIRLSEEAVEHLVLYAWPGNVRELSHEIRRLCALHRSGYVVRVDDLKPEARSGRQPNGGSIGGGSHTLTLRIDRPLAEVTREVERAALGLALQAARGRMELAAKRLGISRKGLYLKRHRLGLD